MKYSNSRITNLVRINGKRVDLSQLEKEWNKHPSVKQCAVIAIQGDASELQLAVFVTAQEQLDCNRIYSEINLPEGTLSKVFIQLSALPLLSDGKVDKELLSMYAANHTMDLQVWEEEIKSIPNIRSAAVVIEEVLKEIEYVHIDDLLDIDHTRAYRSFPLDVELEETSIAEAGSLPPAIIYGGSQKMDRNEPVTLVDILVRAVLNYPDKGIYYIDEEGEKTFQSYRELLSQAKRVLTGLKQSGLNPKDKVVFQLEERTDFIPAFWGCILGGYIPVPVTVPRSFTESKADLNTLEYIVSALEHPYIITNAKRYDEVRNLLGSAVQAYNVMKIDDLKQYPLSEAIYRPSPEDLTIILYTSGSTGMPKGVMQTHQTIISRERGTTLLNQFTADEVSVNWMPLEHVGGIVMFHIKEMYLGCTQIQVHTNYILTEPLRWLDLMDQYKATLTWAPNFAYSLVAERLETSYAQSWDLSAMRFILNAGEAITAKSCKKFLTKLHKYGLRSNAMFPAWGMSETCSGVIYSDHFNAEPHTGIHMLDTNSLSGVLKMTDRIHEGITFTQLGRTIPGVNVRIVNSKNELLHEGEIGLIQIQGGTTTPGYYNNPDENEKAFTPDGWFNTGDQGFIYGGSLTITGRLKDLLIINGVNYSNAELEGLVEEIDGISLSFTAVCAIRENDSDTDKIAIFFVSELQHHEEKLNQVKKVRKKISDALGLKVDYIIPVTRDDIPKTNIGKIQRSKLAAQFKAGVFKQPLKEVDVFEKSERTLPNWFFEKKWSAVQPGAGVSDLKGRLFLIIDDGNHASVAEAVIEQGGEVQRFSSGESLAALERLPTDILYFVNSGFAGERLSRTEIDDYNREGIFGLLRLIQSLSRLDVQRIQLYVVTKNSQHCLDEPCLNYADAIVQGFLKSASLENPWLTYSHIDFDFRDEVISGLMEELKIGKLEDEVAYRQGKRYIPLLFQTDIQQVNKQAVNLKTEGMYLISGGLGGIGVEVIKELSDKFALKFIVIGRTDLNAGEETKRLDSAADPISYRIRAFQELESKNVDFLYVHGDITDVTFLKKTIDLGRRKWGKPLAGVLHLAGEGNLEQHWKHAEYRWIHAATEDTYKNMFTAKVYGTLALHEALKDDPEALLVLFSSVNGYFGASTFSAYSAANSFMDQFSVYRARNGYPNTYCFSWSQWDNIGMSFNNPTNDAAGSKGFMPLSVKQGVYSLLYGLSGPIPHLFVGLDRNQRQIRNALGFAKGTEIRPSIYYTLNENEASPQAIREKLASIEAADGCRLIDLLDMPETADGRIDYTKLNAVQNKRQSGVGQEEPMSATEAVIASIFKEILQVGRVNRNDSFFELGGHSLKATQVLSRIQNELQVKLPVQTIFQYHTVKNIAKIIDDKRKLYQTEVIDIPRLPVQEYYELSHAQKRVYILTRMDSQSNNYNILGMWRLTGALQAEVLRQALQLIVDRNQSLRAAFVMVDGNPVQKIKPSAELAYHFIDLSELGEAEQEKATQEIASQEAERNYNLETGPLMAVSLLKTAAQEHLLLIAQHHIISDGWSLGLLVKELGASYQLLMQGGIPEAEVEQPTTTDYFTWHNQNVERNHHSRKYWLNQLSGELPILELPLDFPRPAMQTYHGDTKHLTIHPSLTRQLEKLSQAHGTSLFMTLLAAFKVLLYKLTGHRDIIVGSPIAGRNHKVTEKMIGMFVNTIAFRTQLASEETFVKFLEKVKHTALAGYEHQDYPFDRLVDEIHPERDVSRTPIFQVMMGLLNLPLDLQLQDLQIQEIIREHKVAKFDLTLHVFERNQALSIYFEYNTDLFRLETIRRFMKYYEHLLEAICRNPTTRISEIDLLDWAEREYLIHNLNQTQVAYPGGKTIQELFEEQVNRHPQKTAVSFKGQELTYTGLNEKANVISNILRGLDVRRDDVVGIMVDRSIEAITGILGILKAGGAYLPIDPKYPAERITHMLEASNVKVLLVTRAYEGETDNAIHTIHIDDKSLYEQGHIESPHPVNDSRDLAYVIYTSGSTGQPKGVMVEHRNVVRLVKNNNFVAWDAHDHLLQTGALTFDASTFEIWGALLNGLTLYIVDDHVLLDARRLGQYLSDYEISLMWLSSPLFNQLSQENPSMFAPLKSLIVGGDALSSKHVNTVRRACPGLTIINGYGPTENTTFTTNFVINREYTQSIPIGRPTNNTTVYILDRDRQLSLLGVPGELYTGGDGVARGYINDPAQTAEKFISDPFKQGGRLYRTGDIVRWNGQGCMEYIGRVDNQVKIRGFRIEREEIVNTILASGMAKDCVVVVKTDPSGHKRLIAYAVPASSEVTGLTLKHGLKNILPDYMIPGCIVMLNCIPLLNNGKVDYKSLPEPNGTEETDEDFLEPRNEVEKDIVEIYREVMGLPKVSLLDSFFELGGDSLLSIKVVSRLREKGYKVDPKTIFMSSTPEALAEIVAMREEVAVVKQRSPEDYLIPLNSNRHEGIGLILAPPAGGTVMGYIQLAQELDCPVYALQSPGLFEEEEPQYLSYEELISLFVKSVDHTFRPGKDYLGGHSIGGHIAFGMCLELIRQGRPPKGLIILDTTPSLQLMEGTDHDDVTEDELKMLLLALGMGNMMGIPLERIKALSYEDAKQTIIEAAKEDEKVIDFMTADYLDKYLQLQLHNVMMSRVLELEAAKLSIPIIVMKTTEHPDEIEQRFTAWKDYSLEEIRYIDVPGNHVTMMRLPHVKQLALLIEKATGEAE
ncbi:amino acid adenylation domain-containing protein [Paenibacillus sophorae]|uniref:Amino acid adenylation domain-containing protein n=1 Tax=Paenibacillus sophorae TaxID=1333845 RepID=A0A1H8PNT8_9BACL|nr:non-ribosomal peptide synthetase [Paenibacillus sophorae]QWU16644.1 non-ribosomal peptide synthetase [Paenibacillus sophorae]SEO43652.1 amino acid adenylation domain-containing protein [Paenibacillus sophorae]